MPSFRISSSSWRWSLLTSIMLILISGPTRFTNTVLVSGACVSWLGGGSSSSLTGSTSSSSTLDFFLLGTHKPANEDCTWEITCPAGTHVGYKNYKFMTGSGVNIKFYDITTDPSNTNTISNYHSGLSQFTTYTTHDGRKALFPGVEKLKIQYTTTGSTSGWGFKLDYRCYTDLCPSDLVSVSPSSVSTATASYWENNGDFTPGTTCLWSNFFSCATPTDTPIVSFTQRSYKNGVVYKFIADGGVGETSIDLGSFGLARVKTTHIASSYSLQLSVPANPIYFDSGAGPGYMNTRDNLQTWGTCQPATATTCYAPTRAGTLTDSGLFLSDPSGTSSTIRTFDSQVCSYTVTCSSGSASTSITFTGKTASTSPTSHNNLEIRDISDSTNVLHSFTTSESTFTFSGGTTTVELYWRRALSGSSYGFSGAEVSYQCDNAPVATPAPLTTLPPATPTPATPAPVTPIPVTPVPETPVPETPVPETPVPETPVPTTLAPQTPAPLTPVPMTTPPSVTPVPETTTTAAVSPSAPGVSASASTVTVATVTTTTTVAATTVTTTASSSPVPSILATTTNAAVNTPVSPSTTSVLRITVPTTTAPRTTTTTTTTVTPISISSADGISTSRSTGVEEETEEDLGGENLNFAAAVDLSSGASSAGSISIIVFLTGLLVHFFL